jgi:hypothetical protein
MTSKSTSLAVEQIGPGISKKAASLTLEKKAKLKVTYR